jgi:hypothetical protein
LKRYEEGGNTMPGLRGKKKKVVKKKSNPNGLIAQLNKIEEERLTKVVKLLDNALISEEVFENLTKNKWSSLNNLAKEEYYKRHHYLFRID